MVDSIVRELTSIAFKLGIHKNRIPYDLLLTTYIICRVLCLKMCTLILCKMGVHNYDLEKISEILEFPQFCTGTNNQAKNLQKIFFGFKQV